MDTIKSLEAEYAAYIKDNKLPEGSAEEVMAEITSGEVYVDNCGMHVNWLLSFGSRWDAAQAAEDAVKDLDGSTIQIDPREISDAAKSIGGWHHHKCEGAESFYRGMSWEDCPYSLSHAGRSDWVTGWALADIEYKEVEMFVAQEKARDTKRAIDAVEAYLELYHQNETRSEIITGVNGVMLTVDNLKTLIEAAKA